MRTLGLHLLVSCLLLLFGTMEALADRILLGSLGEPVSLIPYLTSDSPSHEVAGLIYIAPLRYDKNLQPEAWAAESWSIEDAGRRMRFKLREGILWEDGEELTAEDVAFTYKLIIDPQTACPYADDFLRVKSFTVLDRYTFEVCYEQFFARALASWMSPILPKHILEKENIRSTPFARKPIGAGPYRLVEWKAGSTLKLLASETYFRGKPNIEEVIYRIIPDTATMFMETRAGHLDIMDLTPLQYLRQTNTPEWQERFTKYRYLASVYVFLGFNMQHPFFKDVRVRRAISLAINREDIVKGVLLGQGLPAFGPLKPGSWAYHPSLQPVRRDLQQAKALLHSAGYVDSDGDGIVEKDGLPFTFTILTNQGNVQRMLTAMVIQQNLLDVGVKVQIRTIEWAAFIHEFINKGRFDAVILGWTISEDPDIYQIWHSSQAHDGGLNFTRYVNLELDRLLEQGRSLPEQSARKAIYYQIQEILAEEQPYCFLFVPYALPVVQKRFQGIEPALAGIMYNFEDWWTDSIQP